MRFWKGEHDDTGSKWKTNSGNADSIASQSDYSKVQKQMRSNCVYRINMPGERTMKQYQNVSLSPEERAAALLEEMDLNEKMAQTGCYFGISIKGNDSAKEIQEQCPYGIGSVSTLGFRELDTKEEAAGWQRRVQKQIMEQSPHGIPAMFHMEGLCGGFVQGNTSIPSGINRGSTWDPELEEDLGSLVSRQEKAVGVTHVLAPVLDISRDSRMGRQGETYGEDPVLAGAMGAAFARGVQQQERCDGLKAESVAKHFAGFHNSLGGIHGAESMTGPRLMQEVYTKPFQAAIQKADLHGIMPCYCSFDGETASSSENLLTHVLREEMGFDGLVVADYSAIENQHTVQGLYESMGETGYRSMKAGMDMDWPQSVAFGEELKEMFETGEAPMEVLDRAVLRILTAKFRMGLFEHPFALEGEELEREFSDDRTLSYRSAVESLVLLKNEHAVLPIHPGKKIKIALIGPHADNISRFFGGYTHLSMAEAVYAVRNSIAGIQKEGEGTKTEQRKGCYLPGTEIQSDETQEFYDLAKKIYPNCKSLREELEEQLPEAEILFAYGYPVAGNDCSRFAEAMEQIRKADVVLLTLGGKHGSCSVASMGEGVDTTDINLPFCQDAFIKEAASLGKPMVGIHFNGRPISSDVADEYLDAILEAWNPSEMGAKAIVDVLLGKVSPSGKLPVSVAYRAGQIPVFYNHPNGSSFHQGESIGFTNYVDLPHTPRYSFGYGLSYTTFAYDNLKIEQNRISPEEETKVSCRITNTGSCKGTEIVQLYLKDVFASMVRPCMELAGFTRVELEAGESKEVTFTVAASQMAFLNTDMEWIVEKGEIKILVGAASDDIRLEGSVQICDTRKIRGCRRALICNVEV